MKAQNADTTLVDRSRCPACSATVRPDAQWCSLCYLDLRPPPPQPELAVLQRFGVLRQPAQQKQTAAVPTTATGSVSVEGAAGWPCTSCSTVVSIDLDACPACGAAFLGRIAGDSGRHRSSTTSINRVPRPARLAAGVLAGIVLALLVPVLLALFG